LGHHEADEIVGQQIDPCILTHNCSYGRFQYLTRDDETGEMRYWLEMSRLYRRFDMAPAGSRGVVQRR